MPSPRFNLKVSLVAFAGFLVVATCIVGGWIWFHVRGAIEARTEARTLLIAWQSVFSSLKDAETGVRGFVITEDEAYLEPFETAVKKLPEELQKLTLMEQSTEGGYDAEKIAEFQRLSDGLLGQFRELLVVARREGRSAGMDVLKEGAAKRAMDAVRHYCETHLDELDRKLRSMDAQMHRALTSGGRGILAMALAAVVAGLAAWSMLRTAQLEARRNERLVLDKMKADRASVEKSTFLATMSHEIRTPMNAILGFGELLLTDARDERQERYAKSIVRSGQALLQLINDILDISKIEAGMLEIITAPVNVREISDFVRQLFAEQCSAKGIDLLVEVDDAVPSSLVLDGARLRQIVMNLAGNAIKFTERGHVKLRFHGRRASDQRSAFQLVFEVEDTGAGIPKNRMEEIFQPFVQAKASRDAELKGTGLGLAIVKRLATLMGGTISVRSEEGRGSTFTLVLPGVEISARLARPVTEEQRDVDFNQLRPSTILIVDDNPVNLSLVEGYFEGTHHKIHTAANGREALDWLAKQRPDVMLLDIRMPVLDGRSTLAEVRKTRELELLPVIAVTASSLVRDEVELRKSFDGYVRKPFSRAQLFDELSHFIVLETAPQKTEPVPKEPAPSQWGALASTLRELERSEWVQVRDGMVMSEVLGFAETLRSLARSAACPPLEGLAERIRTQAEAFAVDELEKTLASFPAVLSDIERRAASASS